MVASSKSQSGKTFRDELIDKLEEKAKATKQQLVTLEKTIRVVKKLIK